MTKARAAMDRPPPIALAHAAHMRARYHRACAWLETQRYILCATGIARARTFADPRDAVFALVPAAGVAGRGGVDLRTLSVAVLHESGWDEQDILFWRRRAFDDDPIVVDGPHHALAVAIVESDWWRRTIEVGHG
jgi:hypothetical protein